MGKTPTSVAVSIIVLSFDGVLKKKDICDACKVSIPTINKIERIVKENL